MTLGGLFGRVQVFTVKLSLDAQKHVFKLRLLHNLVINIKCYRQ